MLIKDIPLTNQVARLTEGDKNSIGEILFGKKYDQDCVNKIWEHILPLVICEDIKKARRQPLEHGGAIPDILSYMYQSLEKVKIKLIIPEGELHSDSPVSWKCGVEDGEGCILPLHSITQVKKRISTALGQAWIDSWEILGDTINRDRLNYELLNNGEIGVRRWFCAPYQDTFRFKEVSGEEMTYQLERVGGRRHRNGLRESMLSDFQCDPLSKNWEDTYPPRDFIREQNNLAPPNRKMCEKGTDPRRRYLREQYHIISENYEALSDMWGKDLAEDEEEMAERIKNFCVNANLWSVHKGPNGNPIFKKNQSDIKYYKDYLKIQLGLLITPYKNTTDKIGYVVEGKRYFHSQTHMGFRKGRWRKYGIGEVEAYNCSLLNYIGREQIFQKDGEGLLFIRDGQYLIRN